MYPYLPPISQSLLDILPGMTFKNFPLHTRARTHTHTHTRARARTHTHTAFQCFVQISEKNTDNFLKRHQWKIRYNLDGVCLLQGVNFNRL
jgi:hypothetical protein